MKNINKITMSLVSAVAAAIVKLIINFTFPSPKDITLRTLQNITNTLARANLINQQTAQTITLAVRILIAVLIIAGIAEALTLLLKKT